MPHSLIRDLPESIRSLGELALDLRWTWSHAADTVWARLDAALWTHTRNPWLLLQNVSRRRLEELARDADFRADLARATSARADYLSARTWWDETRPADWDGVIAYFSMEYGLGEALPIYSGGLGVLAGDHLKTASDLGVPIVAVGMLYQEGYFRQMVDAHGRQIELYPANLPHTMPIIAVRDATGERLKVLVDLPGRTLRLHVWLAQVGRVRLYLLDSNDPLNTPADRGITGQLYGGGKETRLAQEIVLGIGGWRTLEALGIKPCVCHLNEGHAALVTLERARAFMRDHGVGFWEALWTTRAGNVFTTHTPVAAAFDTFPVDLLAQYGREYAAELGIPPAHLVGLGRRPGNDDAEQFNMAYLAARTCFSINAVSRLHGEVSRRIFQDLYPRWPQHEVPVGHITNGVHMPSWDSPWADRLWTEACGKNRWLGSTHALGDALQSRDDAQLWHMRGEERADLVRYARERLAQQLAQRGADAATLAQARNVLDPNLLTLGFARRFTEYKRPNLLLRDPDRLARLLTHPQRPVQLIVAGKAHPRDELGKDYVQAWVGFTHRPEVRAHVVYLEDYDIALAQQLVQGVDVWINTPRREWEACGTSGMKVLVNGGLNLSELDGWWAEAWSPEIGWRLAQGDGDGALNLDAIEAEQLYRLLEHEVVPEFYDRDATGIPRRWLARMRACMATLTPRFSSNRMLFEYVRDVYLPATAACARRSADDGRLGKELAHWVQTLKQRWRELHLTRLEAQRHGETWEFSLAAYLGELSPDEVQVQLYTQPTGDEPLAVVSMRRAEPLPGAANGFIYRASAETRKPAEHFTPRVVPHHPEIRVPLETTLTHWAAG